MSFYLLCRNLKKIRKIKNSYIYNHDFLFKFNSDFYITNSKSQNFINPLKKQLIYHIAGFG